MSSYESLIGKALIGDEAEKTQAMQRVSCKAAAQTAIFCPCCNNVMDQKRVVCIDLRADNRTLRAICKLCWDRNADIRRVVAENSDKLIAYCWRGELS